jgi:Flp pilus assembly protein CpaB
MEAPNIRGKIGRIGGGWSGQLLTSRRGSITVAAISAVLAGALIYLFVQHYRQAPVAATPTNATVFIATKYIPAGTPAATIASGGFLTRTVVPVAQVIAGAITDPSEIVGEASTQAVASGQQASLGDFSKAAVSIGAYLKGTDRAIAVPLDLSHGLTAYLRPGATVDILVGTPTKTIVLAQNVPILANTGGDVVLKVTDKQTLAMASASDKDKIWLTLRPATGATQSVAIGNTVSGL